MYKTQESCPKGGFLFIFSDDEMPFSFI